jgi:hypothetical protein
MPYTSAGIPPSERPPHRRQPLPFPKAEWAAFKANPLSSAKRRAVIAAIDAYRATL